jgi:hypothetical protein
MTSLPAIGERRVPRAFLFRLVLAYLGLYSAVLSAALVTLALRIEHVEPQHSSHDPERCRGAASG